MTSCWTWTPWSSYEHAQKKVGVEFERSKDVVRTLKEIVGRSQNAVQTKCDLHGRGSAAFNVVVT